MSKTICIFGDSITEGHVDPAGGWADRLKRFAWEKYDGDCCVYNLGISGNNSEDVVRRFASECDARDPDVIIFAIGINDSQYIGTKEHPRTSQDVFEKNMEEMVSDAKRRAHYIVCVGLTPVVEQKVMPTPWNPTKFYDNENVEIYDAIVRSVACEHGCLYVSMHEVLSVEDLPDGLHPNAHGHEKMFIRIKEMLIDKGIM